MTGLRQILRNPFLAKELKDERIKIFFVTFFAGTR